MYLLIAENSVGSSPSPAQMVLTTSGGKVTLSYAQNIGLNSQGVTVYLQVLEESNNYTFQYYYIGFDTTSSSYNVSELELYVSAYAVGPTSTIYTDIVRIAYTNTSFVKTSDSYLFIIWLIEFQNIPSYLIAFTPTLQNNVGIMIYNYGYSGVSVRVYFDNGTCNFSCGGNCPSSGLGMFITYVQNNSVVLEFPVTVPLGAGVSNLEVLFCVTMPVNNMPTISGQIKSTLAPPVSGATIYVAIATVTVTYQGS
jgi:hypothetical protein